MLDGLAEALPFVLLPLVGDEGITVDLERGRVRRIERERKRLRVREFFVGDVGTGGIGM